MARLRVVRRHVIQEFIVDLDLGAQHADLSKRTPNNEIVSKVTMVPLKHKALRGRYET